MSVRKLKHGWTLVLMLGMMGSGAGLAAAPQNEPEASATEEPLPAGAVARLGTLRFRHDDYIRDIAIGTDGTSILSAAGKAVYVWDLATGKERRRFQHETPVTSFVCSRDGKLLASGCEDGMIHLWDKATGRELQRFKAHAGAFTHGPPGVYLKGFTPDGRQLISTGQEFAIRLWDATSGKLIHEIDRLSAGLSGVALSPDGKTLAGVVRDNGAWLLLWEVATGRELKRKSLKGNGIHSCVYSPDGKILAITDGEANQGKPCDIHLWDAESFEVIRTLRGHIGWVWCRFSPDGKTLVSRGNDGARLWDAATGKEIGRIGDKFTYFMQILFCLDNRTLVSSQPNHHALRFWDRASGKEIRSTGDAVSPIDFLSFSPDGRLLAAGSKTEWDFRIWDVHSRKKLRRLLHGSLIDLRFAPDGGRLATAAFRDEQARIWDAVSGKELRRIRTDNFIECLAWSADGKLLATWSTNTPIRLWNTQTGQQLRALRADLYQIGALVFSPNSKTLAALSMERRPNGKTLIFLWAADTGEPLPAIETPISFVNTGGNGYPRLAFSPDGRALAAGGPGTEESSYLWETATGRRRLTLDHGENVDALAFSPDGKLLAAAINLNYFNMLAALPGMANLRAGGKIPRVHLWDIIAEKELPPLEGHQGSITSLSFSPDGKLLATGGNDTTVLLWDATRFKTERPAEIRLDPDELDSLWADLRDKNAVKAYRAIRTLATAPKASVAFLQRHLQPVAPVEAKLVARLLADLDSDQFAVREKAMQQLEKLGDRVATELRKTLAGNPPLEVKRRIEQLLDKRNGAEQIRMIRALETLETIGTPEARALCAKLAAGVADAPLTREARATLRRMER